MAEAAPRLADGSRDFSSGVDSGKVPSLKSDLNPNGLTRNQLSWGENISVRGGPISPRTGWQKVVTITANADVYNGGFMYDPRGDAFPWLVTLIGTQFYEIRLDINNAVIPVSPVPAPPSPLPNINGYHFCQAEEFLVIQPGDGTTLPMYYFPNATPPAFDYRASQGVPGQQITAAGAMDYYQGRLWFARGRNFTAGDIVNGPSGTIGYQRRNSILFVTENPLAVGGDGFMIPAQDGNIRAIAHTSNPNTQLGEGQLYVFTRKSIYSISVPVSRNDWIAASSNTQPLQTVVQRKYGATGDRNIIAVNGDLYYRTMEPGVRSLSIALRDVAQPGSSPISNNVQRALAFDDRSLLRDASGMEFDNRLWETCNPTFITGVGPVFRSVVAIDFDIVSSLENKLTDPKIPCWEGAYAGLDILQLFTGDFGGRERAFAVVFSRTEGSIDLWELTDYARRDNGDNRIAWYFETPSYTWGEEFSLKELDGAEIWVDQLAGQVDFKAYYRADSDPCWHPWISWRDCASRGPNEDIPGPAYPGYADQTYCDQYRAPYVLPKPPLNCVPGMNRPSSMGYQFQFKLEVRGWCRIRGLLLYALPRIRAPFAEKFVCGTP